jgi:hypothetical protein
MLIIKRMLVFLGLFILFFVVLGWLASNRQTCCYDSSASAEAWEDSNGNGQRDAGEQSLAGICVWSPRTREVPQESTVAKMCSETFFRTDVSGQWPAPGEEDMTFRAGAKCTDIDVFAKPPDGYVATTPLVVNGCHALFGFAQASTLPNVVNKSYLQQYEEYLHTKQTAYQLRFILQTIGLLAALTLPSAFIATKLVRTPKPK